MKTKQYIYIKITLLLGLIFNFVLGCDRNPSDEAVIATYPKTAEVFTDTPIGLGSNFYFPYAPGPDNPIGSKFTAWKVDTEVSYKGSSSMRFDVPNGNDPEGNYAGGILRIDGAGRDLSGYDALTFWAKATQNVSVSEIGFGEDFYPNKFITTLRNVSITTNWVKYVIPIPDASRLVNERGMFRYAAGGTGVDKLGYTFWIDELKFEKLGTLAHPQPSILNGNDDVVQTYIGTSSTITGLTQTFNTATNINQTVSATPSYYIFTSSNANIATVNELGLVTVIGTGTAKITATLAGVAAKGSLTINSLGTFTPAPKPLQTPSNVISIFSNEYTNQPVEYYNGYWAPYQTTLGQDDIHINGDDIIKYSKLNFVGIQFTKPTINMSSMTHFHVDIQVQNAIPAGGYVIIKLQDIGPDNTFGTADDAAGQLTFKSPVLITGKWVSLDLPLSTFPGLTKKANMAQVVFVTDATIKDIFVDNVYFHK